MKLTWKAVGPSGPVETVASTKAEAERNIRYRLHRSYGMSVWDAQRYDLSDLHPAEQPGSSFKRL